MAVEEDYSTDFDSVNDTSSIQNNDKKKANRITQGAAIAGGITGLVIAGPVLAIVGAAGAAVVASQNKGMAGKIARASGDVVVTAGDSAKHFDEKHHVVDKTKVVAGKVVDTTVPVVQKTGNMVQRWFQKK
jgi:hypothetical protein